MVATVISAVQIAKKYREEITQTASSRPDSAHQPKLVAFLANDDPCAEKYAEWTQKTFKDIGVAAFEVRSIARTELEEAIIQANEDPSVHGILVYYPVFGDPQDQYIQSVVSPHKDVEGLCHIYKFNMYHNVRFLDPESVPEERRRKCIIPCTPLAIVKVLEYCQVYNTLKPVGTALHGKTITIINRSEIVGRPLAALLANDGAKVYSVDVNGILEFHRGPALSLKRHEVSECSKTPEEVLPVSDVVITGVPSKSYKVKTSLLKDGVVAVNFSSDKNFDDDIKEKASLYVPSVGKVTVLMLHRNLLRLHEYMSRTA
ncbi:hypothetical protein MP638_003200 [Amoeboaphelidium occidentale]|nr:hypothetical protein MP638_003200 [Amoeboaphelidium occidentale]